MSGLTSRVGNLPEKKEIELKLEFDPASLERITAHPLLATENKREALHSTYYDTPDLVLRNAGVSLRVRDADGRFVQTIKSTNGNAGVFDRSEWEQEVKRYDIDLIAATDTALEPLLSVRVRNALQPMFETRIERAIFQLKRKGSDIEVALDRGEVIANGRRAPIHEIELELKRGKAAELFRLAREFDAIVPLRIAGKAKAERGYELLENAKLTAKKATPLDLHPGVSVGEAFRVIAQNCLRQILVNEPGVLASDAESLHQMRIGLRRLRTAIAGFAKLFTKSEQKKLKAELKWATNQLGPARDLDVFAADALKYVSENDGCEKEFAEVGRDFALRRAEAYAAAGDFLRSDRFRRSLLDVTEWVEAGTWNNNAVTRADTERPVEEHATTVLSNHRKQVRKKRRNPRKLSARARHKLRIRAKKLRYMIEFFIDVFPGHKNARRREAALTSLKQLQDALGSLNDIAVRKKSLASKGGGLGAHAAAMIDAGAAKTDKLLEQACVAHADFSAVKAFWKS